MAFRFEDWMINHYLQQGYIVFRGIVPSTLIADLRCEIDKAREIAWSINPQAQRLQPVNKYEDRLNQKPFKDYCELPELREAVFRLLGPHINHGQTNVMGIFVEPRDRPWTVGWHRDGVVEVPIEAQDEQFHAVMSEFWHDQRVWNQVNCAIYADSCTWYVPGSHLRQHNLPGEKQHTGDKALSDHIASLPPTEAELYCLDLCHKFPGAVRMHLEPGDYMIYRNVAWHNGIYTPYARRGTLHDVAHYHGPPIPRSIDWRDAKKAAIDRMNARQGVTTPVGAA